MPAEEAECEDLEKVIISDDPEKLFQVRSQLPPREKEGLIGSLEKVLMCSHETLMMPQELIRTSYVTI